MRQKIKKILKYSIMISVITTAWYLLTAEGGIHAVVSFLQDLEKTVSVQSVTSTCYRYEEEFRKTLNHYAAFQKLYKEEDSTAIPGLSVTDLMGNTTNQMVPQGICIAEDYMLITAYSSLGENSVIYVLSNHDPQERRLLTTIILPDVNHVGGITYDGERIWIAKSTTRSCSVIDYDIIHKAAQNRKGCYFLESYTQNVDCKAVASFITYHDDRIWVGTYSNKENGKGILRSYEIIEGKELKLAKREQLIIPGFANGVSFMEDETGTYMAVSTSKGRYFHSEIYLYRIAKDIYSERNLYYSYGVTRFPPMAEELVCDGENTYILFESSATCYSTKWYTRCSYPVDRICALNTVQLFQDSSGPMYQQLKGKNSGILIQGMEGAMYQDRKQYWKICASAKAK